ncbi:MAG: inorganic diphosphatase [Flavobacteriales bacterium]|nr:Inorganic pyrophosphatase [Flavobacteriales bacterium]MCC6576950.1 inorganic diphosphatase [Flavobacteriales bacterium]NUQ16165.1 inorganic diphosphatase [Flavobacteriales bacterium]
MNLEELEAWARPGVLRAVIEIPAGTVEKRQYDIASNTFPIDLRRGKPRRIAFLPYPANYGFIPGTRMDKAQGGDGDAVDVFVLCGAVPSGTVMEVEPIGIIELLDAGERDDKLVALPLDPALRTVEAADIHELPEAARDILVTWLLNYDPEDGAKLVGVKGKADAVATVGRWQRSQPGPEAA